jgi:hypothetical protein
MKWWIWMLWGMLGWVSLTGVFAHGETTRPASVKKNPDFMADSQIWIEGNSSLHRYYLTAGKMSAATDMNRVSGAKALLDLILNRKGHKLVVTLPVESLKSGDAGLDGNAYGKLKSKEYPDIVFTMGDYVVKAYPGSLTTYGLLVSGKLRIAGVERDVLLEPTMVFGPGGLRLYGTQDVYQKDYGISPYSVAVVMTTDNKIVVHYMIALGLK